MFEDIKRLIFDGSTDEAINQLDEFIAHDSSNDEAFFLRGNAYRKKGEIRLALNNYLEAIHRNPQSPAQVAYDTMMDNLNFYYKEIYNQ